jgi:heat shock protein HtpX
MYNHMKVFALMAGLTALLGALGSYFGGEGGLVSALLFAGLMNVGMYFWSSKIVLRMYGAHVVSAQQAPD